MPSGNLSDLIFSEYVEGNGNNKALEIFNGTGTAIDLAAAGYNVQMYFNGSPTPDQPINLTGTIAPGAVFVLALNNNSNPALLSNANQTNTNQFAWYNGNDAVVLRRGTTVVDSIGQIGVDPGTEWGTGLTSTQDNTLTRNRNATGDTNPNDTFNPSSEWQGFVVDTFNGLGNYYSAPILNNATSATLTAINEDIADTSNTGTKLSDLIGSAITDINNDPQGIAVTGVDNSNGTWQYSLNGGGTWLDFGAVSDTNATLLGWTTLYTSQLGTAPGSQGLGYTPTGAAQTVGSGATTLSTLTNSSIYAGYTSTATTLDRSKGYKINFTLKINSEDHSPSSAQKNSAQDNIADRAGFSIIAVSSDGKKAVEIGFWNNEIWVQDDGVTAGNGPLFTHNTSTERYFGDTTVLTNYSLSVLGDNYTLYAGGTAILSGLLRDYSAFTHPILDFYETPNFIFLGDDTTSASGSFDLTRVAVQTAEPRVRFVPNADYDGTANLTFRAWDGTDRISSGTTGVNASTGGGTSAFSNNSNVATVTINPINDAPVLNNTGNPVFNTINEDVPLVSNNGTLISTLLATGIGSNPITDVDAGAVEGIAVVGVDNTNGIWQYSTDGSTWTDFSVSATSATLLRDTARIRFVPNADFNGIVTNGISFRAWDASDGLSSGTTGINPGVGGGTTAFSTATETAKITVTAVNDAPTVTAISDQVINEDTATGAIAFTIGDVETLPENLVVTATSSDTTLIPNANITLTGTGSDRSLVVTPNPNQFGTATITLNVSDGTTTTTKTFQVVVNGVNDAPTVTAISDQVINEDTGTGAIAFTINDLETLPGNLVVTATSSDTTLIPDTNISFSGTGATRTLVVTPAANQFGTATITVNVTDGNGTTTPRTFDVTVNSVNDAPNFTPGGNQIVYAGAGEQTVTGWASGFNPGATNESDQDILSYLVNVTNNANIFATAPTIDAATGDLIYTPVDTLTSSTTATIQVRVRDNGGTANGGANTSTIQTFTITVNPTVVSITALDGTADESGDTGIYKIERVGGTDNTLAVKLQIDNSSSTTSGDYTLSDSNGNAIAFSNGIATVTLQPGQTSVNVILTPVDDTLPELAETLKLNLASGGYKIDTNNSNATVTIAANDPIRYSVEASTPSLTEGNSSSQLLTFTITRSGGIGAASSINYALNGTATNGSDYNNIRVPGGGTSPTGTLNFAAGETTKRVTLSVLGDTITESDEDITLSLSNSESATVTINNDDEPPNISISNVTLTEGNNGTTLANFIVSLNHASSQLITVGYATDNGTATSPNDYNNTSGTVTFNPGVTQQIISIAVVGDFVDESNETFLVNLSNPSNNATLLDSQGVGTITDNDTAGFTLSPINGNTTEGGGTASFTIKLNSQPTSDVTLNFSSSDLTEGQVITSSLTFTAANWNTNQTVTIRGVDDSLLDGNVAYNIITASAVSNDLRYNNLNPNDVSVTNTDNEIQLRVINGTRRSDSIIGTARNEQINGLGGHDTIIGGYGSDRLYGGGGNDTLIGDTSNLLVGDLRCGDDVIFGGTGSDRIYGGGGNDFLYGEAGDDWISGDNGSDRLSGGLGNDILTGGLGQDKFILARGEGIDTIRDFQLGQDAIALSPGMSFNQLSITQHGSQTSIIDTTTNQTLALLSGVNAATLISQANSSFVTL